MKQVSFTLEAKATERGVEAEYRELPFGAQVTPTDTYLAIPTGLVGLIATHHNSVAQELVKILIGTCRALSHINFREAHIEVVLEVMPNEWAELENFYTVKEVK